MSSSAKKRKRQREAREFRKRTPAEQLESALESSGLGLSGPEAWRLGAGVEYEVVAYVGVADRAEQLAQLAEKFPEHVAVVERPATVAILRVGSEAGRAFAEANDGC